MYKALIELLRSTGIPLAEGDWASAPKEGAYAAIALDLEGDTLWGDGRQRLQAIQGTIDLFCRDNDRDAFEKMQRALRACGISWQLNSIQREPSRRLIHYEWLFDLEDISDAAASYFYEDFPGLAVYFEDPYISAPSATLEDGLIDLDNIGLYLTDDGQLTQRLLEDV